MNNSLLYAFLLTGFNSDYSMDEYNEYLFDMEVNGCQIEVYLKLIEMMNEGHSEEELIDFIDNLDLDAYKNLSKEKQDFIQTDAKNILALRKEKIKNE